jgi:hypothetical protein
LLVLARQRVFLPEIVPLEQRPEPRRGVPELDDEFVMAQDGSNR